MSPRGSCLHELDVVRLREQAEGWREPGGEPAAWPAGTRGTVVRHAPGSAWCEVEVLSDVTGETLGFIEARTGGLEVTDRYRPGVETAA